MKKKAICVFFAFLMCMMVALPAFADGFAETSLERANIVVSYGLKHISGSTYKMWAKIYNIDVVTVSASLTLYDASYNYITSISKTSLNPTISLSKDVNLSPGTYHLRLSYTADGATYSAEKTYII